VLPTAATSTSSGPASSGAGAAAQQKVAAILVDGYSFAKKTDRDPQAATDLIQFVRKKLAELAGVPEESVRVPPDALAFFHPDENEARRRGIVTPDECHRTSDYLHRLEREGWDIVRTDFKLVNGVLKASKEDMRLQKKADQFAGAGAFGPIGARPERLTATDVFIVTGDGDHTETLKGVLGNELRWCVQLSPSAELEQWGLGTERLLQFPGVPCKSQHPCKYFQTDSCAKGDECDFEHRKAPLCKFYQTARCKNGFGCRYVHTR